MTVEFCTLFDRNYLPRALVLYRSLESAGGNFRLRAFCMDEVTAPILRRLGLERLDVVTPEELAELDPELAAVRETRSPVEFMWTATPAVCLASFAREPGLPAITYLDADLVFHSDPAPVSAEIGASPLAIIPHRYAEPYRETYEETSGIYNVEWLTFTRAQEGQEALRWWRERCLEWCKVVPEDGKFGDQKYLDDWPDRFPGVHVIEHIGAGLAPWNVDDYEVWRDPASGAVQVDEVPLVFFHAHGLRLFRPGPLSRLGARLGAYNVTAGPGGQLTWASGYPVAGPERELIWEPYLRDLVQAYADVRQIAPGLEGGFAEPDRRELASVVKRRARNVPARLRSTVERRRASGDWSDAAVAEQMLQLSARELARDEPIAPFRVFLRAVSDLVDTVNLPDACPFLDVGCGVGAYSDMLERGFPGRFAYEGWDASEAVIAVARRARPERVFRVASLLEDTIPAAFRVVLASALLDVIEEVELGLETLLGCPADAVVLHRQRITAGATRVERAPGYAGQTTFRSYLAYGDLEAAVARNGRRIAGSYHVADAVHTFVLLRA